MQTQMHHKHAHINTSTPMHTHARTCNTCTCMHMYTCTMQIPACTNMYMHTNISTQIHEQTCTCSLHTHTCTCIYAHLVQRWGTGQLPVLRTVLSIHIFAAKALAYGEISCCRDGKSIKHPEENYTDRQVPIGRDHIRRSVMVEVSPHPCPGALPGPDSLSAQPERTVPSEPGPGRIPWPLWGPGKVSGPPRHRIAASGSSLQHRASCGEVAWDSLGLRGGAAPTCQFGDVKEALKVESPMGVVPVAPNSQEAYRV